MTSPHVPDVLRGAWRRAWIRFGDGTVDDTSLVLWMQFDHQMVDVRLPANHAELRDRAGLDNCSMSDVRQLATSDSSSGFTTCTPIVVDDDGARSATAEWFSDPGVSFQPFTSFPEPGLLEWNDDGTVMMERAPSGSYVEEWHLVPGTAGGEGAIASELRAGERVQRFTMGPLTVEVIDRRPPMDRSVALLDQIGAAPDLAAARALVNCEFTLAERNADGDNVVVASTHPWRVGDVLKGA